MLALLIGFALVSVSVVMHYETLRLLNDGLGNTTFFSARAKVLVVLIGAMATSRSWVCL